MKTLLIAILHALSRGVLKKYKPTIIGITGSVGKTATKEAVWSVLATKYRVRKNTGNFNTEIGLPLTILGYGAPGRSVVKWLGLFSHGLGLIWRKDEYPEMLVLEMGADKPGDIEALLRVVQPKVGIITAIAPTHTAKFGSVAGVAKEKGKLFRAIEKDGYLVVNEDDADVARLAEAGRGRVVTYALLSEAEVDIRATEIDVSYSNATATGIAGVSFKIITSGTVTPVLLPGIIGRHQVYPALAAAAVAQIFDIHMVAVAEALGKINFQPGRMRILPGIKHTAIIDDTYNASPAAVSEALAALSALSTDAKKYAVLADMLELGDLTESEHKKAGQKVAVGKVNILITVGERARQIAHGARAAGMPEDRVFEFSETGEAGLFIQERLHAGDIVLVKGSRSMHMERIVKEIMAEPERAEELLVH